MDYLLSIFFNSNTADDPIDPKTQKLKYPDFDPDGEKFSYYAPWKWHWRQSQGTGWYETGNLTHPAVSQDAALGKVTLRVWNRDAAVKAMKKAQVLVGVVDKSGQGQSPMIKDVFAAFKYQDVDGSQIKPLHEDEDKSYKVVLYDIPGGNLSNADYGDQVMRSWDVGEFCFSRKPHRNYGFVVSLWAEFDQSEPRIFVIDPEMDIGLNLI